MRTPPRAPARSFVRARCSSTRWLPSERPSRSHTSSAPKPSTSRSVTTRRWRSGSSLDRVVDALVAASAESAICSALRLHGRIGEAQWPGAGRGRLDEALGIDRRPVLVVAHERRERRRARLADATGAGEIHHDAEEVGAQATSGPRTCRGRAAGRARPPGRRPRRSPGSARTGARRARARRGARSTRRANARSSPARSAASKCGLVARAASVSIPAADVTPSPSPADVRAAECRASDTVDLAYDIYRHARAAAVRATRRRLVPAPGRGLPRPRDRRRQLRLPRRGRPLPPLRLATRARGRTGRSSTATSRVSRTRSR